MGLSTWPHAREVILSSLESPWPFVLLEDTGSGLQLHPVPMVWGVGGWVGCCTPLFFLGYLQYKSKIISIFKTVHKPNFSFCTRPLNVELEASIMLLVTLRLFPLPELWKRLQVFQPDQNTEDKHPFTDSCTPAKSVISDTSMYLHFNSLLISFCSFFTKSKNCLDPKSYSPLRLKSTLLSLQNLT